MKWSESSALHMFTFILCVSVLISISFYWFSKNFATNFDQLFITFFSHISSYFNITLISLLLLQFFRWNFSSPSPYMKERIMKNLLRLSCLILLKFCKIERCTYSKTPINISSHPPYLSVSCIHIQHLLSQVFLLKWI